MEAKVKEIEAKVGMKVNEVIDSIEGAPSVAAWTKDNCVEAVYFQLFGDMGKSGIGFQRWIHQRKKFGTPSTLASAGNDCKNR
jgi:hypothetical protein